MLEDTADRFQSLPLNADYWSLRLVDTHYERLSVRQDIVQPVVHTDSRGAMIVIAEQGGIGYAATSDLTDRGLSQALEKARRWAAATSTEALRSSSPYPRAAESGHYQTPVAQPWDSWGLKHKLELLRHSSRSLRVSPRIVDWEASLGYRQQTVLLSTSDGVRIEQNFHMLFPGLRASANEGTRTQTRTHGAGDLACQGGLEQLERVSYTTREAARVGKQALELLDAPACPSGEMDLLLMPSQMVLQIHESIGHPLELDRILGDERNYAGTSFVEPHMFGDYQYGTALLNITFDPSTSAELASYAYDDEGTRAEPLSVIRDGVLQRGLGGFTSQARSNLPGVASARASDWNRAPIDRMANLNMQPGDASLQSMIEATRYGVLMDTNRSWSIDDSRNKFQFGCEYARVIRNGKLAEVVRNPNYRGISSRFWHSLAMVGDDSTWRILGTPYCGKGEPNQMIGVGHAAPACLFRGVEIFSGG